MKPNDIPLHLLTGGGAPTTTGGSTKSTLAAQNEPTASQWGRGNTGAPTPAENRLNRLSQPTVIGAARRVPKAEATGVAGAPGFAGHAHFKTAAATRPPLVGASPLELEDMARRIELFTRRGLDQDEAEALADRCMTRDRDLLAPSPTRPGGTGMAACAECDHLGRAGHGRYRCGNWRELEIGRGEAVLTGLFVVAFHRCSGFAFANRQPTTDEGRNLAI